MSGDERADYAAPRERAARAIPRGRDRAAWSPTRCSRGWGCEGPRRPQPLPPARRGGARGRPPARRTRAGGDRARGAVPRLGGARAAAARHGRCSPAGERPGEVAEAVRRARRRRRPRAQHAPAVRAALARGRARGRRARGAPPPQLPPVLLDRRGVPRRRAVLSLPPPVHAAGRRARLPRLGAGVGGLRHGAGAASARRVRGGRPLRHAVAICGGAAWAAGCSVRTAERGRQLPAFGSEFAASTAAGEGGYAVAVGRLGCREGVRLCGAGGCPVACAAPDRRRRAAWRTSWASWSRRPALRSSCSAASGRTRCASCCAARRWPWFPRSAPT